MAEKILGSGASPSTEKKLSIGTALLAQNIIQAGKTVGQGIKKTGDAAFKKVKLQPPPIVEVEGMDVEVPTSEPESTNEDLTQKNKVEIERSAITQTTFSSERSAISNASTTASAAEAMNNFRSVMKDAFSTTGERMREGAQKVGKGVETSVISKFRSFDGASTLSAQGSEIYLENEMDDGFDEEHGDFVPVPPDEKLAEMKIIHRKRLKGITTIQDYYDVAWSDGFGTSHAPVYGPWLQASRKKNIQVSEWEVATDGNEFVGSWCQEKYPLRRTATYEFVPSISFGPPKAKVKDTQFCHKDDDRCVIMMELEFEAIPFSDHFQVEIRWVATRVALDVIKVEIGLYVHFIKSTILARKIRAGTTEETTKAQVSLFEAVKGALANFSGVTDDPEQDEEAELDEDDNDTCLVPGAGFFNRTKDIVAGLLWNQRDDDLALSVRSAQKRLKLLDDLLEKSRNETPELKFKFRSEMNNLHSALDKLLDQMEAKR